MVFAQWALCTSLQPLVYAFLVKSMQAPQYPYQLFSLEIIQTNCTILSLVSSISMFYNWKCIYLELRQSCLCLYLLFVLCIFLLLLGLFFQIMLFTCIVILLLVLRIVLSLIFLLLLIKTILILVTRFNQMKRSFEVYFEIHIHICSTMIICDQFILKFCIFRIQLQMSYMRISFINQNKNVIVIMKITTSKANMILILKKFKLFILEPCFKHILNTINKYMQIKFQISGNIIIRINFLQSQNFMA